jgi:flagellar basal-body rod protein FlgB
MGANPMGGMINDPMIRALGRFLDVNVARSKLIASNISNVDTPGYRTHDLDFRAELARLDLGQGADGEPGSEGSGVLSLAAYAPVARPVRGLLQRPDGNDVSVERESLLLAETQMRFNLGVVLLKDEFHGISMAINSGGQLS